MKVFLYLLFFEIPGGKIQLFKLRRTVIGPIWEEMGARGTGGRPEVPPLCYLLWHLK